MVAELTNYLQINLKRKVGVWMAAAAKRGIHAEFGDAYQDAAMASLKAAGLYVPDSNSGACFTTYLDGATDNALARHFGIKAREVGMFLSLDEHPHLLKEDAAEDFHYNLFMRDLSQDEALLFNESLSPSPAVERVLDENGEHRDSGTGGIATAMMAVHGFSKRRVLKTMGGLREKLGGVR